MSSSVIRYPKSRQETSEFRGIKCEQLHVCYRNHVAIEYLDGSFAPGSMTAIVGPNGGGKSTLLKTINGFVRPVKGTVNLGGLSSNDVAYLPQQTNLDRSFPLTVSDVVAMGLCPKTGFFKGMGKSHRERVVQALESVGLETCANRPLHALSGGQFQRVLFARMSLQDASVILLDEPFAAIDAPTMDTLSELLQKWCSQGRTIVAVLHDLDIVRSFFPETLVLAKTCISWGPTAQALTNENLKKAKTESSHWISCYNKDAFVEEPTKIKA